MCSFSRRTIITPIHDTRGYITSQMRWDKNGYAKRERSEREGGKLVERSSPRMFDESIFGVYCVQRGATRDWRQNVRTTRTGRKSFGRLVREIIVMKADKGAMRFKVFIVSVRRRKTCSRQVRIAKRGKWLSAKRKICPSPFVKTWGIRSDGK